MFGMFFKHSNTHACMHAPSTALHPLSIRQLYFSCLVKAARSGHCTTSMREGEGEQALSSLQQELNTHTRMQWGGGGGGHAEGMLLTISKLK